MLVYSLPFLHDLEVVLQFVVREISRLIEFRHSDLGRREAEGAHAEASLLYVTGKAGQLLK